MGQMLPLFPLGAVLFPGQALPLHVFEERYRQLVRDLTAAPAPRRFGVITIRKGRETGADGVTALYPIGCTATLRQVSELADGRFAVMPVGAQRFRLGALDRSRPYLRGVTEPLPDDTGDARAAEREARAVRAAFRDYAAALAERGAAPPGIADLPDEPTALSYLVAAAVTIDVPRRQALLEAPDAAARLAAERALLARESAMLRALASAPAPDLRYSRYHPN